MENELQKFSKMVPVSDGEFCVDARRLHEAMQVESQFKDWIVRRIEKYGFQEGIDFKKSSIISPGSNLSQGIGGRKPRIDYQLTLDMAKQLAMVENNEAGLLARRYFIQCEEQLKQQHRGIQEHSAPQNYLEALKALVVAEEQRQKVYEQNRQLRSENEALDAENQQLKLETGKHPHYHRVLEDKWITTNIHCKAYGQVGLMLKALSAGLNIPTYSIRHSTHKKVYAYSIEVFEAFRKYCEENPDYLAKWRVEP